MVVLGNVVAVALRAYAESVFLASYGAARLPWLFIASAGAFAAATLGYHALTRRGARAVDLVLVATVGAATAAAPTLLGISRPVAAGDSLGATGSIAVSFVIALA